MTSTLSRFDLVASALFVVLIAAAAPACSGRNHIGFQFDGGSGTAGTGGRGGASGTGAQPPVAGSSGGGGGGAAGTSVNPSGLQPRVLVVDPATNRFVSYDRRGQVVRNYHDRLDLGPGFAARNVWVDGSLMSWDGPTDARAGSLVVSAPNGFVEPLQPSRILIRAQSSATGPTRVRVLAPDAAIIHEHTIAGVWEAFHLSPKRGYIYANRYVATPPTHDVGAVIRASDGMIVAQREVVNAGPGREGGAAFSRDDSRFVYAPYNLVLNSVSVLNPATGVEVAPAAGTTPWSALPTHFFVYVQATVNDRALLIAYGQASDGRLLYSLDWLGNAVNLAAPEMPRSAVDYLLAVDPTGGKVVWSRESLNGPTSPNPHSGTFQLDFSSPPASPWTGGDAACFGRPSAFAFKVTGTSLERCACSDGTCTTIAAIPPVPDTAWVPVVLTNRSGSVVVVTHEWPLSRDPVSYPNILCFSATGQPLASAPYGAPMLDETGQLVLIQPSLGLQQEHAIVDLTSGLVTLIGRLPGWSPRIIYE